MLEVRDAVSPRSFSRDLFLCNEFYFIEEKFICRKCNILLMKFMVYQNFKKNNYARFPIVLEKNWKALFPRYLIDESLHISGFIALLHL